MSIDKFGRSTLSLAKDGRGFKLTSHGDYNIKKRKLKNVGDPKDDADAVNISYLKKFTNEFMTSTSVIDEIQKKLTEIISTEIDKKTTKC